MDFLFAFKGGHCYKIPCATDKKTQLKENFEVIIVFNEILGTL